VGKCIIWEGSGMDMKCIFPWMYRFGGVGMVTFKFYSGRGHAYIDYGVKVKHIATNRTSYVHKDLRSHSAVACDLVEMVIFDPPFLPLISKWGRKKQITQRHRA
jgi:hypothetical protein